ELEVRMRVRFLDDVRDLSEYPDHVLSVVNGHRRDLDSNTSPLGVDDRDAGIGRRRPADDLPREQLAGPPRVLGCDDRGELSARDVTDNPARRGIDPADDAIHVDPIARHVDVLEDVFEVHRGQRCAGSFHLSVDSIRRRRRSSSVAFSSADTIITRPTSTSESSTPIATPSAPYVSARPCTRRVVT